MIDALTYARITLNIAVLALVIYGLRVRTCNAKPLLFSLLIYFGISFTNQIMARIPELYELSRAVIAFVGLPLIVVVIVGLVLSLRGEP